MESEPLDAVAGPNRAAPARAAARAKGASLPTLKPPTQADVEAMTEPERRALLLHLHVLVQQIVAAQGTVTALLDVRSDEPLWTAQQVADVLGVHPDTVRDRGAEWGIEADLGEGVRRYIPEQVRALRARQKRKAHGARLLP